MQSINRCSDEELELLELLYKHFIQHLAHFAFCARGHASTDLIEAVKSMNVLRCNPLWGVKDMGCRQHFCKTPRVNFLRFARWA